MTLYVLEWDNGEEYADHDRYVIAIFSSAEKREQAKQDLESSAAVCKSSFSNGHYVQWETELDETP